MQKVQTPIVRYLMLLGALVSMLGAAGAARASILFSDNFESPNVGGDTGFTIGTNPTGWTNGVGGALRIIQNPDNQTYTGTTGVSATIANMNGPQIFGFYADNLGTTPDGNGSISRTLANTLTLGDTYTATVSIGRRGPQNTANLPLGYVFELLAGSTVIASASGDGTALPNNAFTVFTISHTAVVSDPINQALTILLGTNDPTPNAQRAVDFDALTLTETSPEPASLSLVALTSLALLRRRRA